MRIVFMGTPDFAVPSLRALIESGLNVVGAFTQPDRPAGRGKRLTQCPVKQYALPKGIPVVQVERIRKPDGLDALRALKPDLCVTAAFGQILSKENLAVPPLGTVNVHASLLPAYRGSAPINWCILNGEQITGVTTMFTAAGIDTGDMLMQRMAAIGENETAGELTQRLSEMGAQLLLDTIRAIERGDCPRTPQNEAASSYQPMLTKEMGLMDFTRDARALHNQVRGLNPWPGAYAMLPEGALKVWATRPLTDQYEGAPGQIVVSGAKQGLIVKCAGGALEIIEMQAPGAKRMQAKAYLMGKPIPIGTVLNG